MTVIEFLFWTSVLTIGYIYCGYPALIYIWGRLRPSSPRSRRFEPAISLILVAHNEEARIERRLQNLLSLDYPHDRLEILVGSDGSTDDTVTLARRFQHAGVRVHAFGRRRGKPAVINDLVRRARGEIIVMADARQRFDRRVLHALTDPFADPTVGAVSGELILSSGPESNTIGQGVGFYWKLEKLIRMSESRIDSTVGATGAIYAVRSEIFEPIPDDIILDDVLVPMRIVSHGYRVVFEPLARAFDRVSATTGEEFSRKVRTIAGNFQLFMHEPWLLNPMRNRLWFQTLSHKVLRLLGPLFLLTAFLSNALLLQEGPYLWTFAAQCLFYLGAWSGYALRDAHRKVRLLVIPYVVCLLNWATVVAFFRLSTGRQQVTWDRVAPSRPAIPHGTMTQERRRLAR